MNMIVQMSSCKTAKGISRSQIHALSYDVSGSRMNSSPDLENL